jgi:hypothetical protein
MLRFKDAATVHIHGLTRPDVDNDSDGPGSRTPGAGEPALFAGRAAAANAFFEGCRTVS